MNLGDTYSATRWSNKPSTTGISRTYSDIVVQKKISLPDKSLCLIPQRFAIKMVNRGWILRNVIIWHKPNPMPSSAKDRFTVDFEYVYFFVKSKKYFFEPQYEPTIEPYSEKRAKRPQTSKMKAPYINGGVAGDFTYNKLSPLGRNRRTVWKLKRSEWRQYCNRIWEDMGRSGALWTIPTQSFPEAHFATFPEKLVEPMIKAGCPEFVCTKCGKAKEKIYSEAIGGSIGQGDWKKGSDPMAKSNAKIISSKDYQKGAFKGYTDCGCNADWRPGIVLDCFLRLWNDFTGSCKAV